MVKSKKSDDETAADPSVKSAGRVLSIFEYFQKVRSPKALSEIAQDLKYPISSTLALLRSIQSMGYITYDQLNRTYLPSIKFAMLGQWIQDGLFDGGAIVEMMEHLAALTQESVMLGVQNGLHSQYIRIVHTSQMLSYAPPVGTLRPLLRSAIGRMLLSQQPGAKVLKVVDRTNALRIDAGHTFDPQEVLRDIERVREAGYAFTSGVFVNGAASVAVALPSRPGEAAMALAVGGPANRVDEAAVPAILDQMRSTISEFLTHAE